MWSSSRQCWWGVGTFRGICDFGPVQMSTLKVQGVGMGRRGEGPAEAERAVLEESSTVPPCGSWGSDLPPDSKYWKGHRHVQLSGWGLRHPEPLQLPPFNLFLPLKYYYLLCVP